MANASRLSKTNRAEQQNLVSSAPARGARRRNEVARRRTITSRIPTAAHLVCSYPRTSIWQNLPVRIRSGEESARILATMVANDRAPWGRSLPGQVDVSRTGSGFQKGTGSTILRIRGHTTWGEQWRRPVGWRVRIDQLGRVVVPAEFRKMLGIHAGDLLDMRAGEGQLHLSKVEPECAICGKPDNLMPVHEKHLCADCVKEIRHEPECAICGRVDNLVKLHDSHVCKDCAHQASRA